ncbi:ABC transporter permease subunit [Cohnella zeiphila]|uniref:ABC transporter permease subunit n=1 Tax=Cohnella zeiphila TaxID=2761120 RepID=A0A7X0VW96_9BACL|nr:ABC transporter permease subunit [Cohnella zeiphila]MBB6732187.1 ABC transporter permease subunit [Cohnella zeiphila]
MNAPLLNQMLKVHSRSFGNYTFGSAFYILLMFWLYPSIADNSKALNDLLAAFPEGVAQAFGFQGGFGSMEAFISGEYYGLLLPLILSIFTVLLSTQLMARLIDQGSMAYLLSTPATRAKVASAQALVLVLGLLIIMAVTTAAGFAGHEWIIGDRYPFDASRFLRMNAVAWTLFVAVGGLSFLISAASNDEKRALGLSGAVVFGMYGLDLIGKIGDSVEWLRYVSAFALYRPSELAGGEGHAALSATILLLIGLAGFAAGILIFRKRDLPL